MKLQPLLVPKLLLKLKHILSPKVIQMLKIFQLPYKEMEEQVYQEIKENMCLEVIRFDQLTEYAFSKKGSQSSDLMGKDISEFVSDISEPLGLHEYLVSQLDLENVSEKDYPIARFLIEQLDERGYLNHYSEIKENAKTQFKVSDRKIHEILTLIQSLEPEGVGARSLKECLLIQIREHQFENEKLRDILTKAVTYYLDDLGNKEYGTIAAGLEIETEGVEAIAHFIKENLTANPGANFSSIPLNQHVIASFEAKIEDGNIHLTHLEREKGIQVGLSQKYLQMVSDPNTDKETKTFLMEKIKKAKEWIETIEKRHEALEKLAHYILTRQKSFLEKGSFYLEPLLQKEVAVQLNLSPSTVSRIVSSKYVQTPHGLFSLKQMCPRDRFGKTTRRLLRIVQDMMKHYPELSDEKIAQLLRKEGIPIARRTVNKYRHLKVNPL